tara:strand:- start:379 stop:627 length:249 start_codon:yes stop_codon:yes gene_type:complete
LTDLYKEKDKDKMKKRFSSPCGIIFANKQHKTQVSRLLDEKKNTEVEDHRRKVYETFLFVDDAPILFDVCCLPDILPKQHLH